jgi:hypothetical protein
MPFPSIRNEKNDVKAVLDLMFVEICIITTIIPLTLSNTDEAA